MGYSPKELSWDGSALIFGKQEIPMKLGGLDHAPGEVSEVRLLVPINPEEEDDGAIFKFDTHTPIQKPGGTFIDKVPGAVWVGQLLGGETMTIFPDMSSPIDGSDGGCVEWDENYLGSWINITEGEREGLELCKPMFAKHKAMGEFGIDDPTVDLWYWKMWHAVAHFSPQGQTLRAG